MQGRNIRSYSHKAPEDDREHLRAIANWAGPLPSQAAGAAASANSRVRVAPYTEEHRQQDLQAAAALQNQKRSKRCCNQSSRSVPQLPDDYDVADAEYLTGDDPLLDDLSYEARVFPGRQPQEYAELVAQREANWAERRGRSADERLIQAASTLSLNADVVAGTLSTLQQRLDEYPQQHACCAAAAAAAATAPGLVPTVTVGGDPRSVTYVGFGVGLYGELLVPTFTCSWCGQHEVPPEALGCMPSAPKKGGTWYDVSSFVVSEPLPMYRWCACVVAVVLFTDTMFWQQTFWQR
jgi:hypothetical protein